MSVREYGLKFTTLAKYAPALVAIVRARVRSFVISLGPHLVGDCSTISLNNVIDICKMMAFAQSKWARSTGSYKGVQK